VAKKTRPDSSFKRLRKLTKKLPNNPKIRRSLPKAGKSMKVAQQPVEWLQKALERMRARMGSNHRQPV
jgi:hypothetical protein